MRMSNLKEHVSIVIGFHWKEEKRYYGYLLTQLL